MNSITTELEFIAHDTADLIELIMSIESASANGAISLGLPPYVALVAEESFNYLINLKQIKPEFTLKSPLFESFSEAITKLRARVKLFDDTQGGLDGLIETLSLAHMKSIEWFNITHQGILRSFIRRIQPDVGVFYLNNHIICTTHTALITLGLTHEHLLALGPADMKYISPFASEFSKAAGTYLGQLANYLHELGYNFEVGPLKELSRFDLPITHNDHYGKKLFTSVSGQLGLAQPELSATILFLLAQINFVEKVLVNLLAPTSMLLLRVRFLTAYHVTRALRELYERELLVHENQLVRLCRDILSDPDSGFFLEARQVRNVMAHYGLRKASQFLASNGDPLDNVLLGLCQRGRSEVTDITKRQLIRISDAFVLAISKTTLKRTRALLGDNT